MKYIQVVICLIVAFMMVPHKINAGSSTNLDLTGTNTCTSWLQTLVTINGTSILIPTCQTFSFTGTAKSEESACFPGSALVWKLSNKNNEWKQIPIRNVTINDMIMTLLPQVNETDQSVSYIPTVDSVYAFLDFQNDTQNQNKCLDMIRFTFDSEACMLQPCQSEVTLNHMIFKVNQTNKGGGGGGGEFVPAFQLQVGDQVLMMMNQNESISEPVTIKSVLVYCYQEDYYSPATFSGTLLVDDIWYSNYVSDSNRKWTHEQMHQIFAPLRWKHNIEHKLMFVNQKPEPVQVGIHPYAQLLMTLRKHFDL